MAKYFPYEWNVRKNNKSLKFTNIIENAVSVRDGFSLTSQCIDVAIGKEYAPRSINNKEWLFSIDHLYETFYLTLITFQINFLGLYNILF